MQQQQQPRVTFALPPPSTPSPPNVGRSTPTQLQPNPPLTRKPIQKPKSPTSPRYEKPRISLPPPTLTAAQLLAHAAGSPTTPFSGGPRSPALQSPGVPQSPGGSSITHPSSNSSSTSSSSRWTVSYPQRIRRIPSGHALPAGDRNTNWPGGVIGYNRLPSCYDSPFNQPTQPSSAATAADIINATQLNIDGSGASTSPSPSASSAARSTPAHHHHPLPSPRPSNPAAQQRTAWDWSWKAGSSSLAIHDPDYADGTPSCLAPRSTPAATRQQPPRASRSATPKRLRGGTADLTPALPDQDDAQSESSGTGSYFSAASELPPPQPLFSSEVGGMGPIGTVESVWGEPLSEFRGLRM